MVPAPENIIGYYGFPRREDIRLARERYGCHLPLVDLDVYQGAPDSGLLGTTTCRIISNIVDNAVFYSRRLSAVIADVGEGKCDRGRHIAYLLRGMGFQVIESRITEAEFENRPLVWSRSAGTLRERVNRIMDSVIDAAPPGDTPLPCAPTHGFWGVPPHDFRILDLFPPTTHIYGWTRCVEAGRPSDLELECSIDEGVPTVFFTQSFCAKQDLAHYLAEKFGGMEVDCHRDVNDSIGGKVEAFLKLS
ncbi:MAG: hypothetical protein JXB45_08625 [Candidatus Krumholzibacteriota bacterium]|nr:hypothetical protein [Candidatus Krumholzibacteriota bacterium]